MKAIAPGRGEVALNTNGVDEIADMARAVEVFRLNAIELDALMAERADAAAALERQVVERTAELRVTFENMSDGGAMFDDTPRLAAWNGKFQAILDLPEDFLNQRPTFADYIRLLARRGEYGPDGDVEEQVRILAREPDEPRAFERARPDGRVLRVQHNPVSGGGFVLIYSDITERKQF